MFFLGIICVSCSKDSNEIDSSAITLYKWKLSAFKTSQPIDLNRDGVASTDMTLEFDCIKNEEFHFNQPNDGTFYFLSEAMSVQINPDNSIKEYGCSDIPYNLNYYGNYKMLNTSTIELYFKEAIGSQTFEPYTLQYQLIGDKLIETKEQMYPTTYDATNTRWASSIITITKEYTKTN